MYTLLLAASVTLNYPVLAWYLRRDRINHKGSHGVSLFVVVCIYLDSKRARHLLKPLCAPMGEIVSCTSLKLARVFHGRISLLLGDGKSHSRHFNFTEHHRGTRYPALWSPPLVWAA